MNTKQSDLDAIRDITGIKYTDDELREVLDLIGLTNPAPRDLRRCEGCLKTDVEKLYCCAKCKKARYCSKECQKKHWSSHKRFC